MIIHRFPDRGAVPIGEFRRARRGAGYWHHSSILEDNMDRVWHMFGPTTLTFVRDDVVYFVNTGDVKLADRTAVADVYSNMLDMILGENQ